MRDALSLTERMLAYCPKELSCDQISNVLGTLKQETLEQILIHIQNQEASKLVDLINDLYNRALT